MISRDDLIVSRWRCIAHLDMANCYENHFVNEAYPRLTCIQRGPRGRRRHMQLGKFFYVDGVEVTKCSELLARLNAPAPSVVPIGTDLQLAHGA